MGRDIDWLAEDGRTVTVLKEIPLRPPCTPGSSITVIKEEDETRSSYMFLDPDSQVGIMGVGKSLSAMTVRAEEYARKLEKQARRERSIELFEQERGRVQALPQDEIIAEGCAHKRYGGQWRALRNPLVLMPEQATTLRIGNNLRMRSRRMVRWLDEQDVSVQIQRLPLKVITVSPKHRCRFELTVLDFSAPHAAFYFKVTWM